ncbi:MAG: TrpB-like pyridoxal phosphate-dependent enzyme [Anaerolineae bacterium]|nr:TrpB-like pyridoxal phosphate-dependent enzyme [Anaerolineae bacterium]
MATVPTNGANEDYRLVLPQSRVPTHWYNIQADLPVAPAPVLHPGTHQPVGPADLSVLFPMECILQEVSQEKYVAIPDEVRDIYRLWRPTPLVRAVRLEKALDTPAHIYYKSEVGSPSGSHKLNTALAQAYYNKKEGIDSISTETGAGQWGSALSIAGDIFKIAIDVFMVKVSYQHKPYRRSLMQTYGACVTPSPSERTNAGRAILAKNPNSTGSLGIAISEAVEVAAMSGGKTKYSLGSVLNHVLLHQTVIGQEALDAMEEIGEYPDVVIGCVGGGSNFAGLAFPFLGAYTYDFGDTAGMTPLVKMHTLGHDFEPAAIHAGGLRYHGMAPLISLLVDSGHITARAFQQNTCFEAGILFARTEATIPAPESTHAIRAAIDEALDAKAKGEKRVILFNLSGHGHFDMAAYDAYLAGQLVDGEFSAEQLTESLKTVPQLA